jgi:glycosyltransferase involved in cell wall biosynthesis
MAGLIVHEWIEKLGGAERVLDAMVEAFPDSDIACLWNDAPERFPENHVMESWLARTPLRRAKALALPLMSSTWKTWRTKQEYDWLLVSSYAFAHHAHFQTKLTKPKKFIYAHTPARYLWAAELDPRGTSFPVRVTAPLLKAMDQAAARDESSIASNSKFVQERVQKSWHRESSIIYPPVDVSRIANVADWTIHLSAEEARILDTLPRTFVLGASRFVAYKGLEIVIRAGEAAGLPVVLAGQGPQESFLRERGAQATVPVTFLTAPSDSLLFSLYQRALVYVFPPIEDFGIMPVEAMAAGCPVIANATGGTSESVIDGLSGIQLEEFTTASLRAAIDRVDSLNPKKIREASRRFDASCFKANLTNWVSGGVVDHANKESPRIGGKP